MRHVTVRNETRRVGLGSRVGVADNYWLRLRGLLGRPPLQPGEGLLITPCRAVHMMGMKYPIDVAFLDPDHRVVGVVDSLAPGRKSGWFRSARHALELPAGTLKATGTCEGDFILIEDARATERAPLRPVQGSRENSIPSTA